MIYRLLRIQESSWTFGVAFAGSCLIFFLYRHLSPAKVATAVMFLPSYLGYGLIFARKDPRRCTPFQAALPIPARDIFLAKVFSDVAGFWIASLTVLAAILTSPRAAQKGIALVLLDAGAIVTLARMAIHSIRTGEFNVPRWWRVVVGIGLIAAAGAMYAFTDPTRIPRLVTISVFAICMLGSVVLFCKAWVSLPESFQIAPEEAVALRPPRRKFWLSSFAWLPAARRLLTSGQPLFIFVLAVDASLFGMRPVGAQIFAIVVCWFSIWMTILLIKSRDRWLFSLPISRQMMFLPIVAAPLGILTLFTLAVSEQSLRAKIIGLMFVAAIALMPGFFIRIPTLPERYRVWWAYTRISVMLLTIAGLVWWGIAAGGGSGAIQIESWLGKILPVRLPLLIATAVAVVGVCYWIALKGFCRMEVPPRRLRIQGDQ